MKLHLPSLEPWPSGMVRNNVVFGGLILLIICFGCASCSQRLKCCGDLNGKQTCWYMSQDKDESEEDVSAKCRRWGGTPKGWTSGGIVSGILDQLSSDRKCESKSDVNPKVQETLDKFSRELNDSANIGELHR